MLVFLAPHNVNYLLLLLRGSLHILVTHELQWHIHVQIVTLTTVNEVDPLLLEHLVKRVETLSFLTFISALTGDRYQQVNELLGGSLRQVLQIAANLHTNPQEQEQKELRRGEVLW
jgi:hypothetical protein